MLLLEISPQSRREHGEILENFAHSASRQLKTAIAGFRLQSGKLSYLNKSLSFTRFGVTEQAPVNLEPAGFRDFSLFIQSFQAMLLSH